MKHAMPEITIETHMRMIMVLVFRYLKKYKDSKGLYFLLLFVSIWQNVVGQDPQFTQFSNNPLYLNPALAGATRSGRIALGYRTQWPKITQFTSQYISGDFFIPTGDYNAAFGLGVLAIKDEAGTNLALKSTSFNIAGSVEVHLGSNSKDETNWLIRGGVQYGYFTRKIGEHSNALIFEDQLMTGGSTIENLDDVLGESIQFSDIAVGTVLSGRHVWFGIAAHHLTHPNQSITNSTYINEIEKIYTKWTIHGGWETDLFNRHRAVDFNKPRRLRVESMYMKQGDNEQLILGVNYAHGLITDNTRGNRFGDKGYTSGADMTLILGTSVRAVPLFNKHETPELSSDAVTFQLGFEFDHIFNDKNLSNNKSYDYTMSVVYSYDYGISQLKTNNMGAHEVTMIIRTKRISSSILKCKTHFKWKNRVKFPLNRSYL